VLPFIHSLDVRPALASSGSEISPRLRETALLPAYHSAATSACFIVARLIVEIVQLLMGSDASDLFRDQHSVTSTIAYWNGNPRIGGILAIAIGNKTEQYLGALRALITSIRAHQQGLHSMHIHGIWSRERWNRYELHQLTSWRRGLTDCIESLAEFLQMLDP
jgi:hypothetical protein